MEPLHELREKRGGWTVLEGWPPLYPRNVPFALSLLGGWSVTVLSLSVTYWLSVDSPAVLTRTLLFGLGTLAFAQGFDFVTEYIRRGQYADVSAREILRTPAQLTALLLPLALFATGGGRTGGLVILVGVVLGKSAASLYRLYGEHSGRPVCELGDWFETDASLSEPPPEIDLPDEAVRARVTVSAKSALLGGLWAIAYGFANRLGLGMLAATGFAVIARDPVGIAIGLLGVGAIVAARILSYFFRYGTIEYRRRGDRLVAYGTLLGAPQWCVQLNSGSSSHLCYGTVSHGRPNSYRYNGPGRRFASVAFCARGSVRLRTGVGLLVAPALAGRSGVVQSVDTDHSSVGARSVSATERLLSRSRRRYE